MARFGRIENGIVKEIIVADKLPPFHPTITSQFMEVPDDVDQKWTYSNGSFSAPEEVIDTPPLSQTLREQFNLLIQNHLGQPYLTLEVMASISAILPAVLLNSDNPELVIFSQAPIATLSLPAEMEADRQAILALFGE